MYKLKLLRLRSGERFPMLIDADGSPMYGPTIYTLTELRARNQATNTISAALRAIKLMYLCLDKRGIDLSSRLSSGQLLSLYEVEDIARSSRLFVGPIEAMSPTNSVRNDVQSEIPFFRSVEKVRMRLKMTELKEVSPHFAYTRMQYIRRYLEWLVSDFLARRTLYAQVAESLQCSLQGVISAITARIPKGIGGEGMQQREGLAPEAVSELLRVTSPQSSDNPWISEYTRHRNELIIRWLYHLGLRRGELLGVRISDIDFRSCKVTIHRRADDPEDPRKDQPQSKTKARELPLNNGLIALTSEYVLNQRRKLIGARKHDFLLCADVTGRPMSLPTVNKIFRILRIKCKNLPASLCPHVLRHTWNDHFSEIMDKNEVPEEYEKKYRSHLMGWSETSGTAATYTRRHIREKAQKVSLEMQEQFVDKE